MKNWSVFGRYVVARPEPQALWNRSLSDAEWRQRADAVFRKDRRSEDRGEWVCKPGMPGQWFVEYGGEAMRLRMRLGLTSFKHVGIFPEQAENWDYIYRQVRRVGTGARVLNLFAYTGGASLAARAAGAEVTHVDSVKPVVGWARENMEASGLDGVRWIVDDALKFVRREVKRGKTYHGIVLDPPAYGRGADGEKWVLEEHINEMLSLSGNCSNRERLSGVDLYSMGCRRCWPAARCVSWSGRALRSSSANSISPIRSARRYRWGCITGVPGRPIGVLTGSFFGSTCSRCRLAQSWYELMRFCHMTYAAGPTEAIGVR